MFWYRIEPWQTSQTFYQYLISLTVARKLSIAIISATLTQGQFLFLYRRAFLQRPGILGGKGMPTGSWHSGQASIIAVCMVLIFFEFNFSWLFQLNDEYLRTWKILFWNTIRFKRPYNTFVTKRLIIGQTFRLKRVHIRYHPKYLMVDPFSSPFAQDSMHYFVKNLAQSLVFNFLYCWTSKEHVVVPWF